MNAFGSVLSIGAAPEVDHMILSGQLCPRRAVGTAPDVFYSVAFNPPQEFALGFRWLLDKKSGEDEFTAAGYWIQIGN